MRRHSLNVAHASASRQRYSQNRLGPPQALSHDVSAFRRLEELHLNATLATWEEFQNLLAYLPSLRTLELGYNRLRALTKTMTPGTTSNEKNRTVRSVNLDSNELDDLTDISEAMRDLSVFVDFRSNLSVFLAA